LGTEFNRNRGKKLEGIVFERYYLDFAIEWCYSLITKEALRMRNLKLLEQIKDVDTSRFIVPLLLFGLLMAITIVACDGDTITIEPSQMVQGIQVTGSGSAFGNPDVAILSLGVSVERTSVEEARDEAATAMQRVIDSLKENGVAEKDIHTQRFSIQPRYNYIDGKQVLRGYEVTNTVATKVRNIDTAGEVIDDATTAGGDLIRVQSITFSIDDPKELRNQARVEAMKDAHDKAETLAEQGGVELGKPISISEVAGYSSVPSFDKERASSDTPIEPGQLEITITVTVVYEIK